MLQLSPPGFLSNGPSTNYVIVLVGVYVDVMESYIEVMSSYCAT